MCGRSFTIYHTAMKVLQLFVIVNSSCQRCHFGKEATCE
jgi:hypothetical protein